MNYNQPINGLLMLYIFTRKSYVIFSLSSLFPVRLFDHSFLRNSTVEYYSFFLSYFLHKNIKAYTKYKNKLEHQELRC